jgi:hypothetical protein
MEGEYARGSDVIRLSGNCKRRSSPFDCWLKINSRSPLNTGVKYLGQLFMVLEFLKLSREFVEPGVTCQT